MSETGGIIGPASAEICRPWLRHLVTWSDWSALAQAAAESSWSLIAHWADSVQAHALYLDPDALRMIPVSTPVEAGQFPSLSAALPAAALYERMIFDLWGHAAAGSADLRHWLDHGQWLAAPPMAMRPESRPPGEPPAFLEVDKEGIMLLPLGPIGSGLNEAAHLRLSLEGPTIVRAEALLGFTHKGTLTLMRGKSPRAAARFAARLAGDATVAHSVAFAQAAEAAMDVVPPPRAISLRIVMMEIERIAGHLDNLAEVCRLADARGLHLRCGALREMLLRASDAAFGHRLMMDCIVPGGLVSDIADGGSHILLRAFGDIASELPGLHDANNRTSLATRLRGVGSVSAILATTFGVGGVTGRAAGRPFDLRTTFAKPYDQMMPVPAVQTDGDAAARQLVRLLEIEESLRLASLALDPLPAGPLAVALPSVSGEGIGGSESVRGDIWHWLRLDHGQIAAAFPRDPGWALWPLFETIMQGASVDDVELVRASLGLPASGMDL